MSSATKAVRRFQSNRLVYYAQQADDAYWHAQWESRLKRSAYAAALEGKFEYLDHIFERWLPKDGPVLEAGCGRGQIVIAARVRGWDAQGIDYSEETVSAIRKLFPDLPIRSGDVTQLDVADGHYAGYISIGVIEHRQAGPEPFLDEAYRILRPGGVGVITVPYLNPIRAWKAQRGWYGSRTPDLPFFQYAFTADEAAQYMRKAGFEVVDQQPYGGYKGIIDELAFVRPFLGAIKKAPITGPPTRRWLNHCRYGHMLALVVRKPTESVTD